MNKRTDGAYPSPDKAEAARVLSSVLESGGLRSEKPFEQVVKRTRNRRRISALLWTVCITLLVLAVAAALFIFARGYYKNVILDVSPEPETVTTAEVVPPRSTGASFVNGNIVIGIEPGSLPLDFTVASALRAEDGVLVPVTCDPVRSTVSIPYQDVEADYRLTLYDTGGNAFTFVIHVKLSA